MEYVDQAVQTLHDGFLQINQPQGLVIALAMTIFMGGWKQWIPFAALATIAHIAFNLLRPMISGHGGALALPDFMQAGFWETAGIYFLGYLVIIGVFFFLKSLVFRGSAKAAH